MNKAENAPRRTVRLTDNPKGPRVELWHENGEFVVKFAGFPKEDEGLLLLLRAGIPNPWKGGKGALIDPSSEGLFMNALDKNIADNGWDALIETLEQIKSAPPISSLITC